MSLIFTRIAVYDPFLADLWYYCFGELVMLFSSDDNSKGGCDRPESLYSIEASLAPLPSRGQACLLLAALVLVELC